MKIGLTGNIGCTGHRVPDLAKMIESAGFDSYLTGEHIIVPVDIANPVRHGVHLPELYKHLADPFIVLAAMASVTTRLTIGTNICILPQRNALILAKEVATLDVLSRGRVLLGIGNGWIEEEFGIFNVPFERRVAKANEDIAILRRLWSEEKPSFDGEFTSFPPVFANPKPYGNRCPPILIGAGGANTDNTAVLKRVARIGDGWQPMNLSPEQMEQQLAQLRGLCDEAGRDYDRMDITLILPSPALKLDEAGDGSAPSQYALERIARYREAGVGRVALLPVHLQTAEDPWEATIAKFARLLDLA